MKKNIITRILTLGALLLLSFGAAQAQVYPIQDLNLKGHLQLNGSTGTSGYVLTSGGTGVPTWGSVASSIGANMLALSTLTQQAANTVLGNFTSSTGNVTAFTMPSCSTSGSALTYTSNTGFTCNTGINASQLGGVAAASYALLASPAFTGTPTAPTQALGDSSTDIATDAFVQNQGAHYANTGFGFSSNTTLTAANMGTWGQIQTTGLTITLPTVASTKAGQTFTFISMNFPYTVAAQGADGIFNYAGNNSSSTISAVAGENLTVANNGSGSWYVMNDGFSPKVGQVQFGTGLTPTFNTQVSTTATTTINSPTITVTNATGIRQYQGIYGSFVQTCVTPDQAQTQNYVVSVVGTTVTMSCNATATNGSPVAVQFGQTRYGSASSFEVNNIGVSMLKIGSPSAGDSAGWINQITSGMDYQSTATLAATAIPGGGYAAVFGARTSDTTGGALAFPLQSYWLGDTWGSAGHGGENLYLQDTLRPATAGATPHFQFEQTITNQWASVGEDPYNINATNQTVAHRLDCGNGAGTPTSGVYNCSTAIDIVPNPNAFNNGIVISNGALVTNGNALAMPLNTGVTWFSATNTPSAYLTSLSAGALNFVTANNNGFHFYSNNTTQVFSFNSTCMFLAGISWECLAAPTINAGFGTGPSVTNANGTATFIVHVGTSPGATGTLNMPAATSGWMCDGVDLSQNNSTQFYMRMTAQTSTTVTFTMYNSSGSASSFVAGDSLMIKCSGI